MPKLKMKVAMYYDVEIEVVQEKRPNSLDILSAVYQAQMGDLSGKTEPSGLNYTADEASFSVVNKKLVDD